MSLFGVLFIVLVTLKLAEVGVVAAWSWWWVTAPLWAPFTVFFVLGLGGVFFAAFAEWRERRAYLRRMMGRE